MEMKLGLDKIKWSLLYCLLFTFLLSSCVTSGKVEYFKKTESASGPEFLNTTFSDYVLKPNDELYIQISSLDEASATIFSNGNQMYPMDVFSASLNSHTIDKDGFLELPVIGKIKAAGKTTSQIIVLLKDSLNNILNQPVINVKVINKYVSVLGEVKMPGRYIFSGEKLTIFDAVGMAGDITDLGNKHKVVLVRNSENKIIRKELNLSNADILTSEYYYINPGDIIYVKPMSNKFWGVRSVPISLVLSSITTLILVLDYVKKTN